MMDRTPRFGWILTAIGLMWATAGRAPAAQVTYTMELTASGSLGGASFSDAKVTLTATADTSGVVLFAPGTYTVENATTTVTVAGIGTGTFTDNVLTGVEPGFPGAAFVDWTPGNPPDYRDIIDIEQSGFETYRLTTSFGPVSGTPTIFPGVDFSTTAGAFVMNSEQGDVTFQAVVASAVPEPSALVLAGIAVLAGLRHSLARRGRLTGEPSGARP